MVYQKSSPFESSQGGLGSGVLAAGVAGTDPARIRHGSGVVPALLLQGPSVRIQW